MCFLVNAIIFKGHPRLAPQTSNSRFQAVYSKNKQDKTRGRPKSKATPKAPFS